MEIVLHLLFRREAARAQDGILLGGGDCIRTEPSLDFLRLEKQEIVRVFVELARENAEVLIKHQLAVDGARGDGKRLFLHIPGNEAKLGKCWE